MLRTLSIRDFVIVDRLDLEFQEGFTVLTGETGAGKSILVDALGLVLGERSDPGLVREGCGRAEIGAEFSLEPAARAQAWLEASDLADETGVCVLRRVLEATGRSRAYVNGRPATLAQVKELGEILIDIHGQHEHQSLLRPAAQRDLLDAYAGASELAREVARAWREWLDARRRREASQSNAQALAAEREQLQWQVQELSRLAFSAAEWDTLQADHRRLSHAASLQEAVEHALEALSEGEAAALAVVGAVVSRLRAAAEYDPRLTESLEVLEPAQIQIQEAVYGLRHYHAGIDLDPRRLQEVEQRLEAVHTTSRKYRVAPEQLPETLAALAQRLASMPDEASAEELERRERVAAQAYQRSGAGALARAYARGRRARCSRDRADAGAGHGRWTFRSRIDTDRGGKRGGLGACRVSGRGEPRYCAAPAGQGCIGRGVVASEPGDSDCRQRGGGSANPGVRRGGRRHRRQGGRDRRQDAQDSWGAATRSCASRTCPRSRRRPTGNGR